MSSKEVVESSPDEDKSLRLVIKVTVQKAVFGLKTRSLALKHPCLPYKHCGVYSFPAIESHCAMKLGGSIILLSGSQVGHRSPDLKPLQLAFVPGRMLLVVVLKQIREPSTSQNGS